MTASVGCSVTVIKTAVIIPAQTYNFVSFNLISYRNPELIFELAEPGSARNAKKLTLQLYQYTENEESNILYKKEDYGDFYAKEIGKEYEENQSPEELAVPVGNEFTVDLQN